ncbi:hypothetical protein Tco_1049466 [Tanacetum coccineum]
MVHIGCVWLSGYRSALQIADVFDSGSALVDKLIGSNKSAENLELKLNANNVDDRFICVRNRVVGLRTLASKVVDIYISTISNTLGRILQDIDDDISACIQVLLSWENLPFPVFLNSLKTIFELVFYLESL